MTNLTEDIRSDLTKIFSEREEVVTEHTAPETLVDYAQEVSTYLTDVAMNFDDERARELSEMMDAIIEFLEE
jgi:hypothetical protein